uniref:Proto oncogene serine:threonine protein kinase n=1 Tax=Echinococcus granulosus TaxID=6210 RepID=A0A068W9G5_ECHGR|nr:proto oncogene serine:threonine protein kinase [Echinococcus granulosus]
MGLDGFFVTEQIASGLCSHVLRAVRKRDGLSVVLKCYDAENAVPGMFVQTQSGGDEPILREAYFLQKVQGVNGCVKMVDYFFDESRNQYVIVLEDLTSLGFTGLTQEILNNDGFLTESSIAWILHETIHTLQQMHELNVLHCDIKPDNIFIHRGKKQIKLLDFNIANEMIAHELSAQNAGAIGCTPEYAPPEVLIQRRAWTPASEVWSVGVTAFVLLCKKFPFEDPLTCHRMKPAYPEDLSVTWERGYQNESHCRMESKSKSERIAPPLSLRAKDFLISCLYKRPQCRPSLQRLSAHPFLTPNQFLRVGFNTNSYGLDEQMRVCTRVS